MTRLWRDERGSVLAWWLLTLPLGILCLGLVADAGRLYAARSLVGHIADLAALAGAQELDLERLARGERYILPTAARQTATDTAESNLAANFWPERGRVRRVEVLNASERSPILHPVSGHLLRDPIVFVEVEVRIPLRFAGRLQSEVTVSAQADASILPKRFQ